jgi:hypothetical protein
MSFPSLWEVCTATNGPNVGEWIAPHRQVRQFCRGYRRGDRCGDHSWSVLLVQQNCGGPGSPGAVREVSFGQAVVIVLAA